VVALYINMFSFKKILRSADTVLYVFGTDLKTVTVSLYNINELCL
jgi:hypothetical protein